MNAALANLRWDTKVANGRDKVRHGTAPRGERQWMAKLNTSQALDIRRRFNSGESPTKLAKEYGVTTTHIRNIGKRKKWAHVTEDSSSD